MDDTTQTLFLLLPYRPIVHEGTCSHVNDFLLTLIEHFLMSREDIMLKEMARSDCLRALLRATKTTIDKTHNKTKGDSPTKGEYYGTTFEK